MSNEVAKATENFFVKYGEAATARDIIGRLLKFNKFGEYCAGQDEQQIARGTVLAAYMPSLTVGYIRWVDNRREETIMGPVAEGFTPPRRDELGHSDPSKWDTFDDGRPRDPWQFSNSLILADLESSELYTFSTSSKGGLSAVGELCKQYGKRIRQTPDEVPIIELDVGSYQHSNRAYGEIRYPIFKVTDWIATDKLPPIDGAPAGGTSPKAEPDLALPEPEQHKTSKAGGTTSRARL